MDPKLVSDRFAIYMNGFYAAVHLGRRAVETGSFIESVCLSASVIDAALRIGLILNHQLQSGTEDIIEDLLHQADDKNIVTERAIYKRALKQKLIDDTVYRELNELHNLRNQVVHRYIISDITTKQIVEISARYANMVHVINAVVRKIEDEQLKRGIGMTRSRKIPADEHRKRIEDILEDAMIKKHGDKHPSRKPRDK